jgi:hypothetical protein
MTDSPEIRSAATAAQELDSLRSTVEALDRRIADLKGTLRYVASCQGCSCCARLAARALSPSPSTQETP